MGGYRKRSREALETAAAMTSSNGNKNCRLCVRIRMAQTAGRENGKKRPASASSYGWCVAVEVQVRRGHRFNGYRWIQVEVNVSNAARQAGQPVSATFGCRCHTPKYTFPLIITSPCRKLLHALRARRPLALNDSAHLPSIKWRHTPRLQTSAGRP